MLGYPCGREFVYDEAIRTGKGLQGRVAATAVALGLGVFRPSPVRRLLEHFVLPKPGEGPSLRQQELGFFDLRLIGRTDEGQASGWCLSADRDGVCSRSEEGGAGRFRSGMRGPGVN